MVYKTRKLKKLKGGNTEIHYPPNEINNYISNIIYINLDERKDRKKSILKQLEIFDKNKITRMSGINNPDNSIIACATSHLNAIKLAKKNQYPNVLILEDDAVWANVNKAFPKFKMLVQKPYDVIMLGGTYKIYNRNTYKLQKAQSGSSYLINGSYYDTFINRIESCLNEAKCDKNVDVMFRELQEKNNWYIVIPALMVQAKSVSNIEKQEVDYKHFFYNTAYNPEDKPDNS